MCATLFRPNRLHFDLDLWYFSNFGGYYRNAQTSIKFTEHAANKVSVSARCTLSRGLVSIVLMAGKISGNFSK